MTQTSTLSLDHVSMRYRSTQALNSVTVEFAPGVTVLLGRNGAGKSTLCRIVAGAEQPDSGRVMAESDGVALSRAERMRATGWLPQAFGAPGRMTVRQVLDYAAWLKEVPRGTSGERVAAALEAADVAALADRRVGTLSGGMLRRLGIAQAIVHDPHVLVLDEPTVGLDPEQRAGFHELVKELGRDRRVLFSTHLLEDAVALAEQIVVLDAGRVLHSGDVAGFEQRAPSGDDRAERLRTAFVTTVSGDVL